jgi:hypothetical protein
MMISFVVIYKGLLTWFITNVLSQGLPKNGQSDSKDKSSHAVTVGEAKEHCLLIAIIYNYYLYIIHIIINIGMLMVNRYINS